MQGDILGQRGRKEQSSVWFGGNLCCGVGTMGKLDRGVERADDYEA